jgi:membrane protein YqaA with SNARE-associated domain
LKSLFHSLKTYLAHLTETLVAYGPGGIFLIALLDSAFIPLPGGADAVMILLSLKASLSWMMLCAVAATLGSVIGCFVLYHISRKAGAGALGRFSTQKQARVKDLLDRYDVLAVLIASVLPPPFPFKLFVISAGVFRMNQFRFAIAIAAGRLFRFLLEGYLAVEYGDEAAALLARHYPKIGIALALVLVGGFVGRSLLRNRSQRSEVGGQ